MEPHLFVFRSSVDEPTWFPFAQEKRKHVYSINPYQNGIKLGELCAEQEILTERAREYGRAQECFSVRCKLCQLIKICELIQTPWYLSAPASEFNNMIKASTFVINVSMKRQVFFARECFFFFVCLFVFVFITQAAKLSAS